MSIGQSVLSIEPLGEVTVDRLVGTEALNALPSFDVLVRSVDAGLSLDDVVGAKATLAFVDDDGAMRRVPLVVSAASFEGETMGAFRYAFQLRSPLAMLTHRRGYRTFIDKSVKDIVTAVLQDAGVAANAVEWRLSEQLYTRPQCVQYDEPEWEFVRRLLADEGICAWHESDGENSKLILGDSPASHDETPGGPFGFDGGSGIGTASAFFELERTHRMAPTAVHVRELDVRQPDVPIEAQAGQGPLEHFEFPAWVADAGAAMRRAAVRLEQLQREADVTTASTHSARLVPGRTITVANMADAELDGEYLVTEVKHELVQAGVAQAAAGHYTSRSKLVPHGDRTYRPAVPVAPPRIDGLESMTVTGPPGEEIHVDDLGRIKLASRWDPSGKSDDTTSAWARTTQMNMDGSMILPRVQMAMAVAHRDGRPDMPVAIGKLYNGKNKTPYGLPGKKASASLMSGTSPGGGSVNEIRLSDDAGSQSFGVQASGDQGVAVGGDATIAVGANEAHNVKGNLTEHIQGAQVVSVGGNQTITAGAAHSTLAGVRVVSVAGNENIGADLNRVVDCGVYAEAVGGLYFTQCNTAAEVCKATFSQAVGGAVAVAAGCGTAESVLGMRNEVCGGPRIVAAGTFEDKTYGVKSIQCGINTLTAAATLVHNITAGATIQAAGTKMSSGSKVVFQATGAVNITAAALSVSGGTSYRIAGVHSASGDVNLDNSTAKYKVTKASS